ncbi:MAG: response regulator [Bacteroidetes bacterium]|nr:MAG: response regulator [Bacteroidota bacterium]
MTSNDIKILYVDDEPINLMIFEKLFRKKYKVIGASSGEEGLQALSKTPDLKVVISDMNMPGMTGMEFISKAKARYPRMCYFVLTGYEVTPDITQAIESGMISKYFMKPFSTKEIDESITSALLR